MEIRRTYNPLTLNYDVVYSGAEISPNQVIEQEKIIFIRPVVLLVNGEPVLRKNWNNNLKQKDVCHFVELPGIVGVALFIGKMILYAAIAYAVGYLYNLWFGPEPIDTVEDVETVYSIANDVNRFRIGDPFPEHFGRFICFPPLVQQNYVEYVSTDCQYMYMLGIIGVGEYSVEDVYIDKTPIGDYENCTYNIIAPSGSPTIIDRLVYTSPAITGQELLTSWLTVAVTAPNVEVSEIAFDLVFPSGLIHYRESGKEHHATVKIQAQARKIDEIGDGLTAWANIKSKRYENTTTQTLRYTLMCSAFGAARYEFRIRRTNSPSTESRVIDKCVIEALRGYGADHPDYGDVTLLEVKIKATERLSGNVARKINVICTRKLYPVTAVGFGGAKAATSSIVDACAYIATADNGGQQADSSLDFEELASMRSSLEVKENYFSHRFTKKTMCMDALKQIARCGRSLPIQPGGLFQLVRDQFKTTPSQIYTCDDYTEGTLRFNHALRTDDDSTCVEVEYIDDETWQVQTVLCYDEGGSLDTKAKLTLVGCTHRQHAFEEGMYSFWDDELNRTVISFTAGLKGLIPAIGDMIYVGSRQVDWGQTGQIAHFDATTVWLSEPVDFGGALVDEGLLLIAKKDGSVLGPYTVNPGLCAHSVLYALDSDIVNTIHTHGLEASKFLFGVTTDEILRVRVLKIIPQNNNEIKIEGSIVHDDVHDDPGEAPALGTYPITIPTLDNLIVTLVAVNPADYDYQICWLSSKPKFKLEIDIGAGYVLLVDNLEAYTHEFTQASVDFDIRVTPYIDAILSPGDAKIVSFALPAVPSNIQATDDGIDLTISWDAVLDADYYDLRIEYDGEDIWNEGIFDTELIIPISELIDLTDNVAPTIDIYIKTIISGVTGPESAAVEWISTGFGAEDASTIFYCRSYNDAVVSGTPLLARFQNQGFDYFYIKVYPTISAEVGGTSDDLGVDFRGANDAIISGTPRIGKIESGGNPYYYKQYPTISADIEAHAGITKSIINIEDVVLSGAARVARISINSTSYYFKVYPTKP